MNTSHQTRNKLAHSTTVAAAVTLALLAGCSSAPTKPDGADSARSKLTRLQADPQLATLAPLAMKEAEMAVQAAEQPQKDVALGTHLVFVADRKIDIAQAQAQGKLAVDQRKALSDERAAMQLQARTQEADSANARATVAQTDASTQKDIAAAALIQTGAALDANAAAQRDKQELQRQIDDLQAKTTDRGLVLTLGDVLFASGTSDLNPGANDHLGKLAAFLNKYPERHSLIEGHTDSLGASDYNQALSQRRAESVKAYLVSKGIASSRLTASGKGEDTPVGNNSSSTGRQQNRRVEVIIENQLVSSR